MGAGELLASMLSGLTVATVASRLVPPSRRLAGRLRPYTLISRTSLGKSADLVAVGRSEGGAFARLFGPIIQSVASRLGRLVEGSNEEVMLLKLRQAGVLPGVPEQDRLREYRTRQLGNVALVTGSALAVGLILGRGPRTTLLFGILGFVAALARSRGRLESALENRRLRMRIEIYTVNQLLAMRVRVGGGVVQGVQQLVVRGSGAVVEELNEALRLHRSGLSPSEAFTRIARTTAEPQCARTYALLASAEERGSDLADTLLALSEDVRESRREALRRTATKRRAAMLIPTIAILAPVMLLFVGAPLPQMILGWR